MKKAIYKIVKTCQTDYTEGYFYINRETLFQDNCGDYILGYIGTMRVDVDEFEDKVLFEPISREKAVEWGRVHMSKIECMLEFQ